MTTGEKIASLRKKHDITQEQFAELLKVSRQSVSRWEMDSAFPEVEKLIKISKLFHCSIDYLLNENLEKKENQIVEISVDTCVRFIKECGYFFLATSVDDQPRLRPFGMIYSNGEMMCIATDRRKTVYADIEKNAKVEIASYNASTRKWIRITGQAVLNGSASLRDEVLEAFPMMRQRYIDKEEENLALFEIQIGEVIIY